MNRNAQFPPMQTATCTFPAIHYTLYTEHYTLHTIHYTLYPTHYTLHTIHWTLYTIHCKIKPAHCIQFTLQCTFYTMHSPHLELPTLLYNRAVQDKVSEWDWILDLQGHQALRYIERGGVCVSKGMTNFWRKNCQKVV